jgi:Predicted integral membrane protein
MNTANQRKLSVNKTNILLLTIFIFAFIYRIFLLFNQTYPPGSDIGFHASVISSITKSGNTNFLWNYYQMGGEIELEFPGYHIFASAVMFLTGMPNYVAQAIVAATFSALTVLAVSLVTRQVWNETAAVIVAILVTFSATDIDIACWGGYPNIIVLLMIPTTFYLFLKRDKLTQVPYLISASLLTASIFLTHSLSASIFLGITTLALLAVLIFPSAFGESRKAIFHWILPIAIGALLVSPFLVSAIPIYLNQSAIITSNPAVAQALVDYRTVPFVLVLVLFAGVGVYFWLSKQIKGRFFSLPVFLIIAWLLVPLLLTQGYLVGLYADSVRFQFFFSYPAIILLAVMIDYASRSSIKGLSSLKFSVSQTGKIPRRVNRLTSKISLKLSSLHSKAITSTFTVVCLLVLLLTLPIFTLPLNGVIVQHFYQVMDDKGYQAIEWVKENTSEGSVFASDMGFGWWLTGFGQRPTITDIDLQAISLANEVDISRNVSYLLDTDYAIDNGYLQVHEDGGYIARHNPLIMADVNWAHNPAPFIQFNSDNITLRYMNGTSLQSANLSQFPVTSMQLINAQTDNPAIVTDRAEGGITCSEILTLSKGLHYANITYILQSNSEAISLGSLNLLVNSTGVLSPTQNSLAILDEQNKACSQIIFAKQQPNVTFVNSQDSCLLQLNYNLQANSSSIQIFAGIIQLPPEETLQAPLTQTELIQKALTQSTSLPITTFDYQKALRDYNVSYVVNINPEINSKYSQDPYFHLVFQNDELSIYKVGADDTVTAASISKK